MRKSCTFTKCLNVSFPPLSHFDVRFFTSSEDGYEMLALGSDIVKCFSTGLHRHTVKHILFTFTGSKNDSGTTGQMNEFEKVDKNFNQLSNYAIR